MLQLTPELIRLLRASQLKAEAREHEKMVARQVGRTLNRARLATLAERAAAILLEGEPTMFANEANCRHGFRVALILQGWKWRDADAAAAEIVAAAFKLMGAKRPSWLQGQPEWRDRDATHWRYRHCLTCGGALDDDHSGRHCSRECASVTARKQWMRLNRDKMAALTKAWAAANPEKIRAKLARYVERLDARPCRHCGTEFKAKASVEFCTPRCAYDHRRAETAKRNERACDHCGTPFVARSRVRKNHYCSKACGNAAKREIQPQALQPAFRCEAAE